ncbi:MAG TPA: DNA polymerase Y family protein [Thermoanaerobaculia bacterium]|nr:DNA polymerase Y family protein [Thermoanaerobaculia bacterium]
MPARLACLSVPLFPLAARLRSEPDLKGEAVVVCEGNGNAARVLAATRPARKAGIEIGMTLPQSRAILPRLVARPRDPESERSAREALLEVADAFSPRVEDGGEGIVYIDLDGIPALARGESSQLSAVNCQLEPLVTRHSSLVTVEQQLGRELIIAAEKASLPARIGIASSKLSARIAASLAQSPTVVPSGEEASFLAPLPLARLAPALEIADTLERWGLATIGDLARLPEGEVASRLGEIGRVLHATARGIDPRPLEPRLPALSFSEGMDLEWPLLTLEPFLFVGNAALERLMRRLESQALACTRLEVTLKLDPDGCDARAIALPAPTRDVKTLLTLVRLELEARPPGSPLAGFTFAAHPDRPRRAQLALFGPPALSPDRLATTIARLASLLGADRVGSPRAVDGHRPERFALARYEPPPPPVFPPPGKTGRGLLAVRVLRPPVELEVIVKESGDRSVIAARSGELSGSSGSPRPASLKTRASDAVPHIDGAVRVAAGPWCMEEGWWSDSPDQRDYWDVELSDGALYRIYRDRRSTQWFADGIYD